MFDYFREAKASEIKALQRLAAGPGLGPVYAAPRLDFTKALRNKAAKKGLAVIAEYKRASPSQGDIALTVTPGGAALDYVRAGAGAMSILTEKSKFKGRLSFIEKAWNGGAELFDLPILRKDFIFDPLQIEATARTPAAALLLIVRLTPKAAELRALREKAESFGLQCVVEVLDEADLALARDSGARIIQVNARDFSDLSVDLSRSLNLAAREAGRGPGELWIAASGFSRPEELPLAREAGFSAILAGTALMRGGNLAESLTRLTSGLAAPGGRPQ